jgi:hypothetical protein
MMLNFARRCVLGAVIAYIGLPAAVDAAPPELPRVLIDTAIVRATGRTIAVAAGGDLQAALDAAQPGDTISLAAGATFVGTFHLRAKSGTDWITIRSSSEALLPRPGTRVGRADVGAMATLVAPPGAPAVVADAGAHHVRLIGLEIRPAPGTYTFALVVLGSSTETNPAALPHHLIIDRCYVHGDPTAGGKRGIELNSASTAVIDSYLADWAGYGQDTQAIAGWNGPGPFALINNFIEGAGENVMFGGADPMVPGLVPSDIEVRRNTISKPLAWNFNDSVAWSGVRWSVKNLFELKNAQRVLIDGNVFEHHWVDAQSGPSIVFTVRNQDGTAPWSIVADVTFSNNVVRNVAAGVSILGHDDIHPAQQAQRIAILNNLFVGVGGAKWGGNGRLFQILNGAADVTIDHNTAFHTAHIVVADGAPSPRFVFTNNIALHNDYGVFGSGAGMGTAALSAYFPAAVFVRNVLIGGPSHLYPPDNFFPATTADVGFVDLTGGNVALSAASPLRGAATDGRDPGVDASRLSAALSGTAMAPTPPSTPPSAPADSAPDTEAGPPAPPVLRVDTVPTIRIVSPGDGSRVGRHRAAVRVRGTDDTGVASIDVYVDGALLGSLACGGRHCTGRVTWDTRNLRAGSHTVRAVARDRAGQTSEAAITVVR